MLYVDKAVRSGTGVLLFRVTGQGASSLKALTKTDTASLLLVLLVETSHKTNLESRRKGNRLQVLKRGAAFNSETGGIIGDHL